MSLILEKDLNELLETFKGLKFPKDVSAMLDVRHGDYIYWTFRTPESKRYSTFYIAKKGGAKRRIDAPKNNIKILQQKLNQVLHCVYRTKPSVHGFAREKSVKSNASGHKQKTWVFNIDLKDFFPSINFWPSTRNVHG